MVASEDWDWAFTDPAKRAYEKRQPREQERIVSKRDEIVSDQWRTPNDYLEPLTGVPRSKLRIGTFRLGCKESHTEQMYGYTLAKSVQVHTNRATTDCWTGE